MPVAVFYACPTHPEVGRDGHERSMEAETLGSATPKPRVKREE